MRFRKSRPQPVLVMEVPLRTCTVIVLRHGEASRLDAAYELTGSGIRQAQECAVRLKAHLGPLGALVLTSPARRTHQTGEIIANHLGVTAREVDFLGDGRKSEVMETGILAEIQSLADPTTVLILVTHEPNIGCLTNERGAVYCQPIVIKWPA